MPGDYSTWSSTRAGPRGRRSHRCQETRRRMRVARCRNCSLKNPFWCRFLNEFFQSLVRRICTAERCLRKETGGKEPRTVMSDVTVTHCCHLSLVWEFGFQLLAWNSFRKVPSCRCQTECPEETDWKRLAGRARAVSAGGIRQQEVSRCTSRVGGASAPDLTRLYSLTSEPRALVCLRLSSRTERSPEE